MLLASAEMHNQSWCGHFFLSLYRRQHLSAAAGLSVAAVGTAGLSHHTLTPLLLVFFPVSLFLSSTLPHPLCMCLVSCVLHRCHYWAAQITLSPMSCLSALPSSRPHSPLLFLLSLLQSSCWRVACGVRTSPLYPRHAVPHRCYP